MRAAGIAVFGLLAVTANAQTESPQDCQPQCADNGLDSCDSCSSAAGAPCASDYQAGACRVKTCDDFFEDAASCTALGCRVLSKDRDNGYCMPGPGGDAEAGMQCTSIRDQTACAGDSACAWESGQVETTIFCTDSLPTSCAGYEVSRGGGEQSYGASNPIDFCEEAPGLNCELSTVNSGEFMGTQMCRNRGQSSTPCEYRAENACSSDGCAWNANADIDAFRLSVSHLMDLNFMGGDGGGDPGGGENDDGGDYDAGCYSAQTEADCSAAQGRVNNCVWYQWPSFDDQPAGEPTCTEEDCSMFEDDCGGADARRLGCQEQTTGYCSPTPENSDGCTSGEPDYNALDEQQCGDKAQCEWTTQTSCSVLTCADQQDEAGCSSAQGYTADGCTWVEVPDSDQGYCSDASEAPPNPGGTGSGPSGLCIKSPQMGAPNQAQCIVFSASEADCNSANQQGYTRSPCLFLQRSGGEGAGEGMGDDDDFTDDFNGGSGGMGGGGAQSMSELNSFCYPANEQKCTLEFMQGVDANTCVDNGCTSFNSMCIAPLSCSQRTMVSYEVDQSFNPNNCLFIPDAYGQDGGQGAGPVVATPECKWDAASSTCSACSGDECSTARSQCQNPAMYGCATEYCQAPGFGASIDECTSKPCSDIFPTGGASDCTAAGCQHLSWIADSDFEEPDRCYENCGSIESESACGADQGCAWTSYGVGMEGSCMSVCYAAGSGDAAPTEADCPTNRGCIWTDGDEGSGFCDTGCQAESQGECTGALCSWGNPYAAAEPQQEVLCYATTDQKYDLCPRISDAAGGSFATATNAQAVCTSTAGCAINEDPSVCYSATDGVPCDLYSADTCPTDRCVLNPLVMNYMDNQYGKCQESDAQVCLGLDNFACITGGSGEYSGFAGANNGCMLYSSSGCAAEKACSAFEYQWDCENDAPNCDWDGATGQCSPGILEPPPTYDTCAGVSAAENLDQYSDVDYITTAVAAAACGAMAGCTYLAPGHCVETAAATCEAIGSTVATAMRSACLLNENGCEIDSELNRCKTAGTTIPCNAAFRTEATCTGSCVWNAPSPDFRYGFCARSDEAAPCRAYKEDTCPDGICEPAGSDIRQQIGASGANDPRCYPAGELPALECTTGDYTWTCRDGSQCIRPRDVCDGGRRPDCDDGSDEDWDYLGGLVGGTGALQNTRCMPTTTTTTQSPCAGFVCPAASGECKVAGECYAIGRIASCRAETNMAEGTPCDDQLEGTVNDVCDGAGNCAGTITTPTTAPFGWQSAQDPPQQPWPMGGSGYVVEFNVQVSVICRQYVRCETGFSLGCRSSRCADNRQAISNAVRGALFDALPSSDSWAQQPTGNPFYGSGTQYSYAIQFAPASRRRDAPEANSGEVNVYIVAASSQAAKDIRRILERPAGNPAIVSQIRAAMSNGYKPLGVAQFYAQPRPASEGEDVSWPAANALPAAAAFDEPPTVAPAPPPSPSPSPSPPSPSPSPDGTPASTTDNTGLIGGVVGAVVGVGLLVVIAVVLNNRRNQRMPLQGQRPMPGTMNPVYAQGPAPTGGPGAIQVVQGNAAAPVQAPAAPQQQQRRVLVLDSYGDANDA